MKPHLSCEEAKRSDLVDYLSALGHCPDRHNGPHYWYLSPLREEKHASFVVNRKKNLWYDFGTGEGGTIIDFGMQYFHCSLAEVLQHLQEDLPASLPAAAGAKETAIPPAQKINIRKVTRIVHPALCQYLHKRKIPIHLARQYCKEVHYKIHGKSYFALGFQNNAGGYELRNASFKGGTRPKAVTSLVKSKKRNAIAVFEGFFSFLSFLHLSGTGRLPALSHATDILVLNTLAFLKKSRLHMEQYPKVHLFLDLDKAGDLATQTALQWGKQYRDERSWYHGYADCNELLVHGTSGRIKESDS